MNKSPNVSSDILYRSFTPDLEVQSSANGGDGRTVVGIAVPYNVLAQISPRVKERFMRGAFDHQLRASNRVPFVRNHLAMGGSPIGAALMFRDDAAGLYGEWRVSATPLGDETLELIKDGVYRQLSIGFRERQNRRLPGGVVERVTADLREVAVVLEGAYGDDASIESVRSAEDAAEDFYRLEQARRIYAALPLLPIP